MALDVQDMKESQQIEKIGFWPLLTIFISILWAILSRWIAGPFYGEAMNQSAMAMYFLLSLSWVLGGIMFSFLTMSIIDNPTSEQKTVIWLCYFISLFIPFIIGNI